MTRLIDTMTDVEIHRKLSPLFSDTFFYEDDATLLTEELENLFKPVPHWTDNLDVSDSSTWVLCWVSDKSASSTCHARWITSKVFGEVGPVQDSTYEVWKYTTPVDLNLRYTKGEDTL